MSEIACESQTWTIRRLLSWVQQYLGRQGLQDERLCAELLIAHAVGCRRIELYTRFDQVPTAEQLARLRVLVRQAGAHVPIAYLTGHKDFFSLDLQVSPAVLIPRPETETLVETVIHEHRDTGREGPLRICDVCTGSGCIAIALAKNLPRAVIAAADLSAEALAIARHNVRAHRVEDRVALVRTDLLGALSGPFDVVTCNPPYISERQYERLPPAVRNYEPAMALRGGPDGLAVIRRLIARLPGVLRRSGRLYIETAFDQAATVVKLLREQGGWSEISAIRDSIGHQRVVVARR